MEFQSPSVERKKNLKKDITISSTDFQKSSWDPLALMEALKNRCHCLYRLTNISVVQFYEKQNLHNE